jgi:flagellar basal body-associated protein FliL
MGSIQKAYWLSTKAYVVTATFARETALSAKQRLHMDEKGQVGTIVLIGILVVIAIAAGVLIFKAVSSSANHTAGCINSVNSAGCNVP